jgi:serine/threonine-protein kinase
MDNTILGLKPGSVIQDTYRVDSLLGEGGMGATFLGVNMAAGHQVAIKVMTPEFARNKRALELFKRESSLLRTVQNDAVVRYETTLKDKAGRLYLVMEYVPGKPLRYFLEKGARLAARDVLKLGERLASGLAAIHVLGIVHRDVAPDNILVPDEDILGAKFIDFGLASDTAGTDKSILGNDFAGKLKYCAPEQLGLFGNKVVPATDIYALGLVMMKTAGLALPGEDKGWAALDDRREDIRIDDVRVSKPLRRVLESMLKADPSDRPDDLLKLIRQALSETDRAGEGDEPAVGKAQNTGDKKPRGALVAAILAGAVAVGGGGWYLLGGGGLSDPVGASLQQVEGAQKAVEADDPLAETVALLDAGGADNLNAAFGALMALSGDETRPPDLRQRVNIMIARMYDPETHDTARSPFPKPNPPAARRYYQKAADLGSTEAATAVERLSQ